MIGRSQLLPDERFSALLPALEERVLGAIENLRPRQLRDAWDARGDQLLQITAGLIGAHALGVWLIDPEQKHLILAHNTSAQGPLPVPELRQPIAEGIVSLVLTSEQPFLENEVQKNTHHSKLVDFALNQQTEAMIVVPFFLQNQCRGVLSCVQVTAAGEQPKKLPGFTIEHLAAMQWASSLLSDLVDYRTMRSALGWT
jgi:transcriptional regulator with GAF, ATPase, and Fis domain